MDFDRHCTEIITQTELLAATVAGADLRKPVPSCPEWTLGMLLRHIGGGQRWAENIVRTRTEGSIGANELRELDGDDTAEAPVEWLVEGAGLLAGTLRKAGPDQEVWTPFDDATPKFWARRFTHETLVHRADATLAVGAEFTVTEPVALDAIDEWMTLDANPVHFEYNPRKRELLGAGRTLAFEAADAGVSWFVDLTGDVIRWRRGPEEAAVTVRAPLTDLLLVIYRRKPAVDVRGDAALLDSWLTHVAFG